MCKGLWDGAYGLSSLCEKTRKSNRLQIDVITKAALSPQLFKDPVCWSGRGLSLRPPAQQTGAYPDELTERRNRKPMTVGNVQRYSRKKKSNWKIQRRERDLFRIILNQVKMFKSLESDVNDLPKFFSRWQDDRLDLIDLIDDSITVITPVKQIIWKFHKMRLSICGADIFRQYSL